MHLSRFSWGLLAFAGSCLICYSVLALGGAVAASGRRDTAEDGGKIAAQLDRNSTTLAKAVAAAEEHSKGRAVSVITNINEDEKAAVHVWCIASEPGGPPKVMKCHVDLASGKVAGMKEVHWFPIAHEVSDDGSAANHERRTHSSGQSAATTVITNQTVDAACGACIYKMAGVTGCPLAIKIDGKSYLVDGAKWPNHDYCDRNCQAIVSGRIEGDRFIASKLEAKP